LGAITFNSLLDFFSEGGYDPPGEKLFLNLLATVSRASGFAGDREDEFTVS